MSDAESGSALKVEIHPEPTEQELAAIAAALSLVVVPALTRPPTPGLVRPVESEPSRWRFAGRWWSKPVPLHRDRP